ncbi:MAG TPA: hypothetical protein VMP89_12840, partial [Solirubrobacteraceae bacterium]|nr:hypothetical protein [Solirubrobacteraceae bacterium]
MGQKRGKFGELQKTRARALADQPLYKALGKIGTVDRSLDLDGLLRYEVLLTCPAVVARVGPNASPETRAIAAKELILEAIDNMGDSDLKTVGQAALCALPPYRDRSVSERTRMLPITADRYKELRPIAVGRVFARLQEEPVPTSPSSAEADPQDHSDTEVKAPPVVTPSRIARGRQPRRTYRPLADPAKVRNEYHAQYLVRDSLTLYAAGFPLLLAAKVESGSIPAGRGL